MKIYKTTVECIYHSGAVTEEINNFIACRGDGVLCTLQTESRETNNKTGEAVVIGFQGKRAAVRS